MPVFDYSSINWNTVTLQQVLNVVRAANAASGQYLDANFFEQAANSLSVDIPNGATRVFYAGDNPTETGANKAWQIAQGLSRQNA